MSRCRACGAVLSPGYRFCVECGQRVVQTTPRAAAQNPKPKQKLGDDPAMRMLLPVGRSGWAIAAGYLGLFSLMILPAPLALFCGLMAIRDIRRYPEKHGMGRAIFGLIVGAIGSVLLAMAFWPK